ncbi:SDR family NAD(P)-dependent oxidoreductase, partial [bacterium]|nr:SDR family NAD(P)-dependent oxidoreductase [bacterium]
MSSWSKYSPGGQNSTPNPSAGAPIHTAARAFTVVQIQSCLRHVCAARIIGIRLITVVRNLKGRLEGKVAIVTGAGSVGKGVGNGRAVAMRFVEEGANVFLIDRDENALSDTLDLLGDSASTGTFCGDVSRADDCEKIAELCT